MEKLMLRLLNFCILQWFFIRLGKFDFIDSVQMTSIAYTGKGFGVGGIATIKKKYMIMKRIVPLTGWWSDYVRVGKK